MPLTKSQIAQRKNSKNQPKNLSTGQFEKKNKASDSSNSDFILSDEIYSSDSDVDIIRIGAEVAIKQGKRNNPENKIGIPQTTKYRKYGPSDEISNNKKDMNESDEFSDDINNKEIGDLEKDNNIANEINDDNFGSSSGEENIATYKYFVNLNKDLGKMEASNNAAKEVYNKDNKGSYKGTCICKWAMYWLKNGALPKTMQDVIDGSLEFIRQNGGKTMPLEYKNFVNSKLLAEMEILGNKKSISDNTSCVWLRKLEARKFLKPGKNEAGWWTAKHLLDQVINYAIPIIE
ncbi:5393_t:CDS:2, partial [Entrophospora sp. SA101]